MTGQLGINLDFHSDSPMKSVGESEFPTIPSTMSALGKRLEEINVVELAKDVQEVLQGASRLVNGPEVKAVLASANTTLAGAGRLVVGC